MKSDEVQPIERANTRLITSAFQPYVISKLSEMIVLLRKLLSKFMDSS